MFYKLMCNQTAGASFWREVVKAFIGFIVAGAPLLLDLWQVHEIVALAIMGAVMAVLTPLEVKLQAYCEQKYAEKLYCDDLVEELGNMGVEEV